MAFEKQIAPQKLGFVFFILDGVFVLALVFRIKVFAYFKIASATAKRDSTSRCFPRLRAWFWVSKMSFLTEEDYWYILSS